MIIPRMVTNALSNDLELIKKHLSWYQWKVKFIFLITSGNLISWSVWSFWCHSLMILDLIVSLLWKSNERMTLFPFIYALWMQPQDNKSTQGN